MEGEKDRDMEGERQRLGGWEGERLEERDSLERWREGKVLD